MKKPNGYWNYENCKKEALKHSTKSEFMHKSKGGYLASIRKGWIDEICNHMTPIGNMMKRLIYIATFPDNAVYIGLTYNFESRIKDHMSRDGKSSINRYSILTKSIPIFSKLSDYISVNECVLLEKYYIDKYKKDGYHVLNIVSGGSIGSNILRWTFEKCQSEALKYNTRNEFTIGSSGAYKSAYKNGWLDNVCSHMKEVYKPKGHWCKERCKEEALKYTSRKVFSVESSVAYSTSVKNKWLDEICQHMQELQKPAGYWTIERCKEEAIKYETRKDFSISSNVAYNAAVKNEWMNLICDHMKNIKKPKDYWCFEKCKEEALKYTSKIKFRNGTNSAYTKSYKMGWIDEICQHMVRPHN